MSKACGWLVSLATDARTGHAKCGSSIHCCWGAMCGDATLAIKQCMGNITVIQLVVQVYEGENVATALHHAMLEMLDDGCGIKYWGAYSVFGLPTVHLPREMLVNMAHPESTSN